MQNKCNKELLRLSGSKICLFRHFNLAYNKLIIYILRISFANTLIKTFIKFLKSFGYIKYITNLVLFQFHSFLPTL
jgi:hypothetical protein